MTKKLLSVKNIFNEFEIKKKTGKYKLNYIKTS